jgi:hypothetical protein
MYGEVDMQMYLDEAGDLGISCYYDECLEKPDGLETFNRKKAGSL